MNAENAKPSVSIWNANYIKLIIANFFYCMGVSVIVTVLPLRAYELNVAPAIIGTIVGCFAITALLSRPFTGPAFDSFPKKTILTIAYVVMIVCTFLYAFVESVPVLIGIRLVHGAGIGCISPLMMALASESLPREKMSSGISNYSLAQALAQTITPAVAIWLGHIIGFANMFIVGAVAIAIALVMVLFVSEAPNPNRPPYQIRLDRIIARRAIVPAVIVLLFATAYQTTGSFVAIYGGLRGVEQIGLYFTVYAACMLLTRPFYGKLADKYGVGRVLVPAMGFFALSFVLLMVADSLPLFILAGIVSACGYGGSMPLVQSLVFKCVPKSARGSGSNTCFLGMDIGSMAGPLIGGFAIQAFAAGGATEVASYSNMWVVMIVPVVLAFAFYLTQRGRLARYEAEAREAQEAA